MNEIDIKIKTEDSTNVVVYGSINGKMVSYRGIFTHGDQKSFFNAVRKAVDYAIRSSCGPNPGEVVYLSSNYLLSKEGVSNAIRWVLSQPEENIPRRELALLDLFAAVHQNKPYKVIYADKDFAMISYVEEGEEIECVRIITTDCLK